MPETTPNKHPTGRPTKLTEEFLAAMMYVVNDADNALIYTDEELIFLVSERLAAREVFQAAPCRRV